MIEHPARAGNLVVRELRVVFGSSGSQPAIWNRAPSISIGSFAAGLRSM